MRLSIPASLSDIHFRDISIFHTGVKLPIAFQQQAFLTHQMAGAMMYLKCENACPGQ